MNTKEKWRNKGDGDEVQGDDRGVLHFLTNFYAICGGESRGNKKFWKYFGVAAISKPFTKIFSMGKINLLCRFVECYTNRVTPRIRTLVGNRKIKTNMETVKYEKIIF